MTLGQRIQALRKEHDLSQEGLGEKLGVSRQAISRWEMDGAVPEVDKLIAMSKLFGVSLNDLLQVEGPEEEAPPQDDRAQRDRRLIRWLAGLCAALILVSAVSLGYTIHFRRQVMNILDPPQPPQRPVTAVEYAVRPHPESMTYDLALSLTGGEELKGWDVTIVVSSWLGQELGSSTYEQEITFKNGMCSVVLEGLPFEYHKPVSASLSYEKKDLQGDQGLLSLEPYGPGVKHWELMPRTMGFEITAVENPELLEPQ